MQFDISFLTSPNLSNGLPLNLFQDKNLLKYLLSVNQKAIAKEYGFIEILKNQDYVQKCQEVFTKFSDKKHLVIVGIGGSDLGARMLEKALKNSDKKISFVGDSTDPSPYQELFQSLNPQETVVNIISKSGSTTESAVGFLLLKHFYEQKGLDWTKYFVFTTDPKEGIMFNLGNQKNIPMLPIPQNVGGRFSVLSPVGLFPALFMGINIVELIKSAYNYSQNLVNNNSFQNPAWQFALQNYLYQKEKNIDNLVIFCYIAKLELFANWFRQLWAESLGKDGKGILPIKAIGPADQHSQVQFYSQGKPINTYLFLSTKDYGHDLTIKNTDIKDLAYLNGQNLSQIIKAERQASQFALAKSNRPSSHLEINKIDAQSLGELIIFFEISVVYLAELLEINAFDQPGVELGKEYMYGLLGKTGFDHRAKEMQQI